MSILDGMYWENQRMAINEKRRKNEVQQHEQSKFNNKMPCNNCNIKDICIHAFSIGCNFYNAELFDITIKCKRYISK